MSTQPTSPNWTPEDEVLDLHGRTVENSKQAVDNILNYCSIRGVRQAKIIYGTGSGKLKLEIGAYLMDHPLVELMRSSIDGSASWVVEVMDCRHD